MVPWIVMHSGLYYKVGLRIVINTSTFSRLTVLESLIESLANKNCIFLLSYFVSIEDLKSIILYFSFVKMLILFDLSKI